MPSDKTPDEVEKLADALWENWRWKVAGVDEEPLQVALRTLARDAAASQP